MFTDICSHSHLENLPNFDKNKLHLIHKPTLLFPVLWGGKPPNLAAEYPFNSSPSSLKWEEMQYWVVVGGGSQFLHPPPHPNPNPLSFLILPQCPTSPPDTPLITESLYH